MELNYKGLGSSSRVQTIMKDLVTRLTKTYPIDLYVPASTMNMTAEDWKRTREMETVLFADLTGYRKGDFSLVQWLLSLDNIYRVESLDERKDNLVLVYKGQVSSDRTETDYWGYLMERGVLDKDIGKMLQGIGPMASKEAVIATLRRLYRELPETLEGLMEALSDITFISDF